MFKRGKFKSLIMVNWNGFFARQYDLDDLVTTLSGGNGAGKSTTMAAFITALIPDLSLLHFRNTTEAGSTSSSRDRGLHGKLKSGVCYAALECENSRGETFIFGARLQQVAGRDKKVDIKLFSIGGLKGENAIGLFFEQINDEQAKILNLEQLKAKYDGKDDGLSYKAYHSLGDYHAQMFHYGFLPKRLRTPQDRSRFYRLIEASLYGGISSTITKSLREYLLPENQAVKKAFQDMESAIVENRMTLNKIDQTTADRDFFKSLVEAAVDYVGTDYIFQQNNRKTLVEKALESRKTFLNTLNKKESLAGNLDNFAEQEEKLNNSLALTNEKLKAAQDHYNILNNASHIQEQYDEKLLEVNNLEEEKEINSEIVGDLSYEKEELTAQVNISQDEQTSLLNQLADQQKALDQQQTRKILYKQATEKLVALNDFLAGGQGYLEASDCQTISEANCSTRVKELLEKTSLRLTTLNENFYRLNNTLKAGAGSRQAYDKAYKALTALTNREVKEGGAFTLAQNLLRGADLKRQLADRLPQLSRDFDSYQKRLDRYESTNSKVQELQAELGMSFESREELSAAFMANQNSYFEIENRREQSRETLSTLNNQLSQHNSLLQELNRQRIPYFQAQEYRSNLEKRINMSLGDEKAVRNALNYYLSLSNQEQNQIKNLENERDRLKEQIYQIEKSDIGLNQDLEYLARALDGVLLSEIYEDIALEDAPYYAAFYGPASKAVVVPSLADVEEKLKDIKDLPEDLYLIENDINNFDEDVFKKTLLDEDKILVTLNDNLVRLSTINPENATFGKASRERFLEKARKDLGQIQNDLLALEKQFFDHQNLVESLTFFVSNHLQICFIADPERRLAELTEEARQIERQLQQVRNEFDSLGSQAAETQRKANLFHNLQNLFSDDINASLQEDFNRIKNELNQGQEAARYLDANKKALADLENNINALQFTFSDDTNLEEELAQVKEEREFYNRLSYLSNDLESRLGHFEYKSLGELEGDELSDQLRARLKALEEELTQNKTKLNEVNVRFEDARAKQYRLDANLAAARETLQTLSKTLTQAGTNISKEALEAAQAKVDNLTKELDEVKERLISLRSSHSYNQEEAKRLANSLEAAQRDYSLQRLALKDNKSKWQESQRIAKTNNLEKRLLKIEFSELSQEELRSKSDRALGLLRTIIADNEYLRDALKASENSRQPYQKVNFFVAVYDHLRERIRQDVLTTDDPIEAIEQMEVQLNHLKAQLQEREKSLVISAEGVAQILEKAIQREQNRIWQLNQGLQNMSFGQVKSVRLNATYRDSHLALLNALKNGSEDHADLFESNELSFTEALAKLYQRTNVDFEIGQRNYQTVGEELLDYRNYINLGIEVFRGSEGWLRAESGALSTGEAIGTGMSILLMVVQSWEEESKRIRSKDLTPCRLLFLDEAARLDAKSIATLFELCERQQMQLLIAAPENISPDNGTTYKLVRRIDGAKEYVHVVGLRGFGAKGETQSENS